MSLTTWWKGLRGGDRTVDVTTAQALQREGAVLLDVRERSEWQTGHADRARHVPLGQLPQRLREVPSDRVVLTICASGMRSGRAASLLRREGRDARNVRGGMTAWQAAGLPVVGGRRG